MAAPLRARGVLRLLRAAAPSAAEQGAPAHCFSTSGGARGPDISQEWYLRQRSQMPLGHRTPTVSSGVWVAPSAVVVGDVDLLDRVSVWFGAVLRGDLNNITVQSCSNIQDRTVVHAARTSPTGLTAATLIGPYVTVEPSCVLRSTRLEGHNIIGTRSVLMEGSMVEPYSILAPGSVLPPARRVPEGELWAGNPARFVRKLTEDEKAAFEDIAEEMYSLAGIHDGDLLPYGTAWRAVENFRATQIRDGAYKWVDQRNERYSLRIEQEVEAAAKRLVP